jgi:D-glycero-alpha-D-manno-heptose-7-phosphate kinase
LATASKTITSVPKATPRVALVSLPDSDCAILRDSFREFRVQPIVLSGTGRERLKNERFYGCVLRLNDEAAALLEALHRLNRNLVHPNELAEQACKIEIDILKEPVGKQDQYIAAYGGLTCFRFLPDGRVEAWPLKISQETLYNLEDNLLLFFTGYSRSASAILKEQDQKSKTADQAMLENLHFVKDLGFQSQKALEAGNLLEFARLMDVHWQRKKTRSAGMSNDRINEWYAHAVANGALGGKLIGAGGGGFLMFYAGDKAKLRHAMLEKGLQEVRFSFDFEGTKVVVQN